MRAAAAQVQTTAARAPSPSVVAAATPCSSWYEVRIVYSIRTQSVEAECLKCGVSASALDDDAARSELSPTAKVSDFEVARRLLGPA